MIRLRPRASDGVAEPRLQFLDLGGASERLLPAVRLPCSPAWGRAANRAYRETNFEHQRAR